VLTSTILTQLREGAEGLNLRLTRLVYKIEKKIIGKQLSRIAASLEAIAEARGHS
jgi:hypothetical protein